DALQRQHPPGRLLPEHAWKMDRVVAGKVLTEPFSIPALAEIIRLAAQRLCELLHQPNHVVLLRHRPAAAGGDRQVVEDLQILLDLGGDARPLHLDHDRCAVRQARGVHLADGGRRQWDLIEIAEDGADGTTELRLDDGTNEVGLQRRSRILKFRQLELIDGRQQIGTRREDLTELDEGRAKLFQRSSDVLRPRQWLLVTAAQDPPQGDEPFQPKDADEEAEAVPSQHLADLSVAAGRRLRSDVSSLASASLPIFPSRMPRTRTPSPAPKTYCLAKHAGDGIDVPLNSSSLHSRYIAREGGRYQRGNN